MNTSSSDTPAPVPCFSQRDLYNSIMSGPPALAERQNPRREKLLLAHQPQQLQPEQQQAQNQSHPSSG